MYKVAKCNRKMLQKHVLFFRVLHLKRNLNKFNLTSVQKVLQKRRNIIKTKILNLFSIKLKGYYSIYPS